MAILDIVEKFIVRHTAAFQKVVAFLCAVGVLSLCVLCSFAVPVLFASAEEGGFEDYVDDAAGIVVEIAESGTISKGSAALLGVQIGLNEAYRTAVRTGRNFSLRNFSNLGGLYWHNNTLHYAWCSIDGSYTNPSDGGTSLMQSDEVNVRALITTDGNRTYSSGVQNYVNNNCRAVFTCNGGKYVTYNVSVVDSGLSDIFPTAAEWSRFEDYTSSYGIGCFYASGGNIPVIPDNSSLSTYFNTVEYLDQAHPVASWADATVSPRIDGVDLPEPDFDFENNTIEDYILYYFNPWIEEEYPDLTIYLWDPSEDPTEDTTECTECGGCNCIHNITVNVEPTVNVEVNVEPTINVYVENQFPTDWIEDYTSPSYPVETVPIPTETATLPTVDLEKDLGEDVLDGLGFWKSLWTSAVWASDYFGIITVVLLLSILEFILWHVGR